MIDDHAYQDLNQIVDWHTHSSLSVSHQINWYNARLLSNSFILFFPFLTLPFTFIFSHNNTIYNIHHHPRHQNAVAIGSYFGATIIDTGNIENADFTDAQFPPKTLALMCDRPDMKGTNPTTGADTRESAMCP